MRLLFSFENQLPNAQADAEVFVNTASAIAKQHAGCTLAVPSDVTAEELNRQIQTSFGTGPDLTIVPVAAANKSPGRQHLAHVLALPKTKAFQDADVLYTRHLLLAMHAVRKGMRVVVDHYRPWADQVPPFQRAIHWLMSHDSFLGFVAHSEFAKRSYIRIGIPEEKIRVIHNGYSPSRFGKPLSKSSARKHLGFHPTRFTVVYTGRVNHKKGLDIVIAAAKRLPEILFVLVGSESKGDIEKEAENVENIQVVPWQEFEKTAPYLTAADVLLIPPSDVPLRKFGSTVLPLKVFLYLGAGRTIVGPATPDVMEVIEHNRNGILIPPGDLDGFVHALAELNENPEKNAEISRAAASDGELLTWDARAAKILSFIEERNLATHSTVSSKFKYRRWAKESASWFSNLLLRRSWVSPVKQIRK